MIFLKISTILDYCEYTMEKILLLTHLLLIIVMFNFVTAIHDESVNISRSKSQQYRWTAPSSYSKRSSSREQLHSRTYSYGIYKNRRPNIILFVTDDQDIELGSLNFMSETTRLLREGGAEFRHAYATTPMCCPSRSSMLTGLYIHNHNVYTNNDNCSNFQWQLEHETRSFATYLYDSGYYTGYFGKYLNKYNGTYTPPGWKEWGGLIMNSKYYNYSVNLNGKKIRHGDDYYKDYYTDLVANDSVNFLRQWKTWHSDKPTLLVMSFPAPHGPEDSAPQYSDMFLNVTTHHTPTYDYAPNLDKQWILQVTGKMLPIHKQFTDVLMTKRLQTLQSVDHAVKRIYDVLKESDELENTYLIYTSDHGYHLGQFGLVKGKSFPFEFDVRIPFLIRGPGIKPGSIVNEIALNIDLAPTILDIAGIEIPIHMDGRSLVKLFNQKRKGTRKYIHNWPDTFLIESSGRRDIISNLNFRSDNRITYSPTELVDIPNSTLYMDSEEISSVSSYSISVSSTENPNFVIDELNTARSLSMHEKSIDQDFNQNIIIPSKAERLSLECQRQRYSVPCKIGQKWYCVLKDNRWRKHKCRFASHKLRISVNLQKCHCITEDGIVYTRFQTINEQMYNKSSFYNRKIDVMLPAVVHYLKPNKSFDEMLDVLAKTWKIMKRSRRNSAVGDSLNTTPILDVIDGSMAEFEFPIFNNQANNTSCIVSSDGSVRCSPEMYSNPELLKTTLENLMLIIKNLQIRMKKLKNIQQYLEKKQPVAASITNNGNQENIQNKNNYGIYNQNSSNYNSLLNNEFDESTLSKRAFTKIPDFHKHRHQHFDSSINISKIQQVDEFSNEDKKEESVPDRCYCVPYSEENSSTAEDILKEQKRRLKEQRIKKKEKKLKRKEKLEKVCFQEKMNCFSHDNQHWKTAPYWKEGPFCFCMNANNNTYNCIRTINITHNFLYCEFITGLITFYNLKIDPFQQWNRFNSLNRTEKSWLKNTLAQLLKCKGSQECGFRRHSNVDLQSSEEKFGILDRRNQKRNLTHNRGS